MNFPVEMTDYWKSTKKHLCPICKYWVPDNPGSRKRHDLSDSHKARVAQRVQQSITEEREAKRKKIETSQLMDKINDAATASVERDSKLFRPSSNHPLQSNESRWLSLQSESGEAYLFNPTSGETKWADESSKRPPPQRPVKYGEGDDLASISAPSSHHGWFTCRGIDGRIFYRNELTGATQMNKPLELGGTSTTALPPKPVAVKPNLPVRPSKPQAQPAEPSFDISSLIEAEIDANTGLGVWKEPTQTTTAQTSTPPIKRGSIQFSLKPIAR